MSRLAQPFSGRTAHLHTAWSRAITPASSTIMRPRGSSTRTSVPANHTCTAGTAAGGSYTTLCTPAPLKKLRQLQACSRTPPSS
eukprot:361082-Chlamydomonas_euryale.AAC.20